MEKVKTWQKVTIAILAAALLVVITVIVMNQRNGDSQTAYAENQAGYTEVAETQPQDYSDEINDYTSVPATVKAQSVPSAKEIANEVCKQFEKQYGKTYKSNSTPNNSYYNPYYTVYGTGVQIAPYHIWYQDGKMYADCYVINANPDVGVTNINVDNFRLANGNGKIADYSFGLLDDISIDPGKYISYRFIFPKGTFQKADLTNTIEFQSDTTWDAY